MLVPGCFFSSTALADLVTATAGFEGIRSARMTKRFPATRGQASYASVIRCFQLCSPGKTLGYGPLQSVRVVDATGAWTKHHRSKVQHREKRPPDYAVDRRSGNADQQPAAGISPDGPDRSKESSSSCTTPPQPVAMARLPVHSTEEV